MVKNPKKGIRAFREEQVQKLSSREKNVKILNRNKAYSQRINCFPLVKLGVYFVWETTLI